MSDYCDDASPVARFPPITALQCTMLTNESLCVLSTPQKEQYHVEPNGVVYSSAISACSRGNPPNPQLALDLLTKARNHVPMNVVGYNAALSACANAGQWELAIQLLEDMLQQSDDPRVPMPDAVTYGTVLAACEKGEQWQLVLKYARQMQEQNLALDGMSATSALHACQQLGLAQEAMDYLNLMKTSVHCSSTERMTAGRQRQGAREALQGPDAVAYRLAISACARGGEWATGIYLLDELRELTNAPPDVVAYTAAISGCEYAGEWTRAFELLGVMRKDGVEPNEFTMAAVMGACATACANAARRQPMGEDELQFPKRKALQLLNVMKRDPTVCDPNIVVYNGAIRACAEAMDLDRSMALLNDLESRGLEPTVVTFGSLMTACERVGNIDFASKVFKRMKESEIVPNEIIYGAAISCCRKARDGERALLLLRKMLREQLAPNVATFNTVIVALTADGRNKADMEKAMLVFKLMKSKYAPHKARPNRQTYNLLIRAFAANQMPQYAEAFLVKMRDDGFVPDVDLYTATVTSYERTSQPLKALRLMESMQEDGYDFYEIKVLDEAFKKAVKLVNAVAGSRRSEPYLEEDEEEDFHVNFEIDGDGEAFLKGKKIL